MLGYNFGRRDNQNKGGNSWYVSTTYAQLMTINLRTYSWSTTNFPPLGDSSSSQADNEGGTTKYSCQLYNCNYQQKEAKGDNTSTKAVLPEGGQGELGGKFVVFYSSTIVQLFVEVFVKKSFFTKELISHPIPFCTKPTYLYMSQYTVNYPQVSFSIKVDCCHH